MQQSGFVMKMMTLMQALEALAVGTERGHKLDTLSRPPPPHFVQYQHLPSSPPKVAVESQVQVGPKETEATEATEERKERRATEAPRDQRESLVSFPRLDRPHQEQQEQCGDRREKKEQRAVQALVTLETKVTVGPQDLQAHPEPQVLQLRWSDWGTALWYNRCPDHRDHLELQVKMDHEDLQEQMENRETQERMGKLVCRALEELPGVRAVQEPKDKRESVERDSQDLEDSQDLRGPAPETVQPFWIWKVQDSQT